MFVYVSHKKGIQDQIQKYTTIIQQVHTGSWRSSFIIADTGLLAAQGILEGVDLGSVGYQCCPGLPVTSLRKMR